MSRLTERRVRMRGAGLAVQRLTKGGLVLLGLLISLSVALPSFKPGDVVLAGILILFTQPFRLGDQIVAGPFEGTVEDIQTRATFIRTYDGRRIVIPNAIFSLKKSW